MNSHRMLLIKLPILTLPFCQISFRPLRAHQRIQIFSIQREHTRHKIKILSSHLFTKRQSPDILACIKIKDLTTFS